MSWLLISADGNGQFPSVREAVFGIPDEGLVDAESNFLRQFLLAVADGDGVFIEDDVDGSALGIQAVGKFPGEELNEVDVTPVG